MKKILFALLALTAAGALVIVMGFSWIGHDVQATARSAQAEFGGDPVHALLCVMSAADHPLRDRNRAVWALGRLGDRRAVPALSAGRTGRPCDHDQALCQREIRKALDRCRADGEQRHRGRRHGHGAGHH